MTDHSIRSLVQLRPDQSPPAHPLAVQLRPVQLLPFHPDPAHDRVDQVTFAQVVDVHDVPVQARPTTPCRSRCHRSRRCPPAVADAQMDGRQPAAKMSCSPWSTTPFWTT